MEAMVPLLAESKCRETYAQVGLPNTRIEASQICAGYADGGIDSCQVLVCLFLFSSFFAAGSISFFFVSFPRTNRATPEDR